MVLTSQIDNYPGFSQGVDGVYLAEQMRLGAERFGAETVVAQARSVELQSTWKTVQTNLGDFQGKTVVAATGASPRKLGLPGEKELSGISYCAECDGAFFAGKTVAVIGGGNTAVHDAALLQRICKKVLIIHRRDSLRAANPKQLLAAGNVKACWNSVVTALLGDHKLAGLRLKDTLTGQERELDCDGVFVSIGRTPETTLFQGMLHMDANGYLVADETTQTNLAGVYAAGDVRTKWVRQIVTAVADGAAACAQIEQYLADMEGLGD